jgi:hypothetical protein
MEAVLRDCLVLGLQFGHLVDGGFVDCWYDDPTVAAEATAHAADPAAPAAQAVLARKALADSGLPEHRQRLLAARLHAGTARR